MPATAEVAYAAAPTPVRSLPRGCAHSCGETGQVLDYVCPPESTTTVTAVSRPAPGAQLASAPGPRTEAALASFGVQKPTVPVASCTGAPGEAERDSEAAAAAAFMAQRPPAAVRACGAPPPAGVGSGKIPQKLCNWQRQRREQSWRATFAKAMSRRRGKVGLRRAASGKGGRRGLSRIGERMPRASRRAERERRTSTPQPPASFLEQRIVVETARPLGAWASTAWGGRMRHGWKWARSTQGDTGREWTHEKTLGFQLSAREASTSDSRLSREPWP